MIFIIIFSSVILLLIVSDVCMHVSKTVLANKLNQSKKIYVCKVQTTGT